MDGYRPGPLPVTDGAIGKPSLSIGSGPILDPADATRLTIV